MMKNRVAIEFTRKILSRMLLAAALIFGSVGAMATEEIADLTATCAACHGADGISTAEIWPNLAGQQRNYLAAQMRAIRDGDRVVPTMQPMVQQLSDTQIDALADHYSNLPSVVVNTPVDEVNQAGRNVRANCISCHAMTGNSVTSDWPNLAGQKAGYLAKTLRDLRDGRRHSPVMNVIAAPLKDRQIEDVAEYYSQSSQ